MHAYVNLTPAGTLVIDADQHGSMVDVSNFFAGRVVVTSTDRNGDARRTFIEQSSVQRIVFDGSNVADQFTNNTSIPDTAYGRGGADILVGGNGKSRLEGGSGNDMLHGRRGNDTIRGGNGKDLIYGGEGNDMLMGNANNDQLFGQSGSDVLVGGGGNDDLWGDSPMQGYGRDFLIGGTGTDTLRGGPAEDILVNGRTTFDGSPASLRAVLADWDVAVVRYQSQVDCRSCWYIDYLTSLNDKAVRNDHAHDQVYSSPRDWLAWSRTDIDETPQRLHARCLVSQPQRWRIESTLAGIRAAKLCVVL
jgi:hypothetical protein